MASVDIGGRKEEQRCCSALRTVAAMGQRRAPRRPSLEQRHVGVSSMPEAKSILRAGRGRGKTPGGRAMAWECRRGNGVVRKTTGDPESYRGRSLPGDWLTWAARRSALA
ncbi:hypothetical protein Zm00014a_017380 [Zea mays]|uniref:Uncharacterized protein n=1 Tax=Zea mays TaxID=4577 RepID=A0A3L6FSF4_MAIZE|nr:hypothetical protein Zm00014a_017380 [Zea mays]